MYLQQVQFLFILREKKHLYLKIPNFMLRDLLPIAPGSDIDFMTQSRYVELSRASENAQGRNVESDEINVLVAMLVSQCRAPLNIASFSYIKCTIDDSIVLDNTTWRI